MRTIGILVATAALTVALGGCNRQASEPAATASGGPVAEPTMAAATDKLMEAARAVFKPIPLNTPKIDGNDATPEKLALGKMLYFDPRLSASHAISCNSCHVIGMGGVDLQETSLGHRWQRGGRNAPTVYNAVFKGDYQLQRTKSGLGEGEVLSLGVGYQF